MAIYDFLNNFQEISFHMPGHKGRPPVPFSDVTELSGTDNLMCPNGIIQKAQENLANVIGKQEVFFLTNGASSGILASILATTKENETVLVDRNCHVSVLNGLVLSGAVPRFIYPKENEKFHIPKPLETTDFDYRDEKTVIVTSPTYYGEVSDLDAIRSKIGSAVLIQDESHGAHFYFCDALQKLRTNASDLSVLSFHKTMPTLNQGAVLALNSRKVSSKRIKQAINMVTTTSPSYPILSSLDYSAIHGKTLYNEDIIHERINALKQEILQATPLMVLENDDCYKLLLNCDRCSQSALQIQAQLEQQHHIYVEGAFGNNLLLMFSPCNTPGELTLLRDALLQLSLQPSGQKVEKSTPILRLRQALSPREAFFAEGEIIPKKQAVGRVSKENITQFPPCVPLVTLGEVFSEEAVCALDKDYVEVVK